MEYIISFLEGIITFISPCLLPMIPIYIIYFAGGLEEGKKRRTLVNSLGFVLGFTVVFVILGAFAGIVGSVLIKYKFILNIITGGIVTVFGLNYIGIVTLKFLNTSRKISSNQASPGFFKAILFGIIFSIGWTPCVGAFLGSALMLASQQGSVLEGVLLLVVYSAGLGIPFILSAILIDRLEGTFSFIKKYYHIVNLISGILLIVVGILMMTGLIDRLLSFITITF